jgi:1-acyl-sn-glycerol-3-phosphate acyltransferase
MLDAPAPPAGRDVATIRRWARVLDPYAALFSPRVLDAHHVPESGPVLLVGNHSLYWVAEAWVAVRAVFARRGIEAPVCGLAYDLLFQVPWFGTQLRRAGAIPAAPAAAEAALARGELVTVYPGGDLDACRAWPDRDKVELGGRKGFVRLALRAGVPVVPVVTHGGQHMSVVLARGDRIARAMRLTKLRVNVFPIMAGPPFGVATVLTPPLTLPAAITVQFLPALDWSRHGPGAVDDPAVVDACYAEITAAMQGAMDRLAAEHPHPLTDGVTRLLGAPLRALDPRRN